MCSGAAVTALYIPQLRLSAGSFPGPRCGWDGRTWSTDGDFLTMATARSWFGMQSTPTITSTSRHGWQRPSINQTGEPITTFEISFLRFGVLAIALFFTQ